MAGYYVPRPRSLENALEEAKEADKHLHSGYETARDVMGGALDTLMFFPNKLLGGIDYGIEQATGFSPMKADAKMGEAAQAYMTAMLTGRPVAPEIGRALSGEDIKFSGSTGSMLLDAVRDDALEQVTPLNVVSTGLGVKGAKALENKVQESINDFGGSKKFVEAMSSVPDNFLAGYYGSPLDRVGSVVRFAVDSVDSVAKSLNPESAKFFKETGYMPVLVNKLQDFVTEHKNLDKTFKYLDSELKTMEARGLKNTPRYKELEPKRREAAKARSIKNRQIEAQVQHPLYIAIRSGVEKKDLPPLFDAMLNKMTVADSGFNPLSYSKYKEIDNQYKLNVKDTGKPLPTDRKADEGLFNRAVKNWGLSDVDPSKVAMIVRKHDKQNPFLMDGDVSPVFNRFKSIFRTGDKVKTYDSVDSLYDAIIEKSKTNEDFRLSGIGLKKGKGRKEDTFTYRGVEYTLPNEYEVKKGDTGVFISIKGYPRYSEKDMMKVFAQENAIRATENRPLLTQKERKKLRDKYQAMSAGVKSRSFLEGGVNFEVHINPKNGRMRGIISDDYNFLENMLPSLERSFEKRILGITPIFKLDLTKEGVQKGHSIDTPKTSSRMTSPDKRNEMIGEIDAPVTKYSKEVKQGMLGVPSILAEPSTEEDTQIPYR